MIETSMILAPPAQLAPVQFSPEAEQMRLVALEACALIGAVRNADENAKAASGQRQIKEVLSAVEKARKAAKAPILDAGKRLDAACDAWVRELKQEEIRVATEIGNFQQAELEKQRAEARRIAAEQARIEQERIAELVRIETERKAAEKAASTATEIEAIAKKANEQLAFAAAEAAQRAEAIKPPTVAPVRAEGQVVRTEWEVVRINDWVLSKARPDLVRRIEFDMVGVKAALARGEKLPGVEAREVVKTSVRTGGKVIDV